MATFPNESRIDKKLGRLVEIDMGHPFAVSDQVRASTWEAFGCKVHLGRLFTVPAVSLEDDEFLREIHARGFIGLDQETGPFLAACQRAEVEGACVHWVTDLPLTRSFYYQYRGDPVVMQLDSAKKHKQWLNMPRLILPIVDDLLRG